MLRLVLPGETAEDFDPAVQYSRSLARSWELSVRCLAGCILCWGGDFRVEQEKAVHDRSAVVAAEEFPAEAFAELVGCSASGRGVQSLASSSVVDPHSVYGSYAERVVRGVQQAEGLAEVQSLSAESESGDSGCVDNADYLGCRLLMLRLAVSNLPSAELMKPFDWEDDFTVMRVYTTLSRWRSRARYERVERVDARRSSFMRIK